MKLYETKGTPNPRRVRIFLAEKDVELPIQNISILQGEHKKPDYRSINPLGEVPALVLDDGTVITESVAICRYLETLHPEPSLFGSKPLESAIIEMWHRRFELILLNQTAMHFRHTHPAMAELEQQNKAWGELNKERALKSMRFFDKSLEGKDFIAGDYSIADITALVALDFAQATRIPIPEALTHLTAYHQRLSQRPSAQAGI